MNKRFFISSFVSLSILLTGCSDSNKIKMPVVEPPVEKTTMVNFNVGLTGMAVKGTMANAKIVVQQIDPITGAMSPISFRLVNSAEPESFTVSARAGTSDEQLDEMISSEVLAANPTDAMTDENGQLSIYLASDYSGPVIIQVSAAKAGDSSWVRCDAYTGCGAYDDITSTVLPNNGDLDIDFGEWYKEDLTLSVIKYIPLSDTPDESRNFIANVTLFSEIVATILQENLTADVVVPISVEAISDASVTTVLQLLGPNGVIGAGDILSDLSIGIGFDLSDISEDITLTSANTALSQLASSLQTIAADGDDGSLTEIIETLAADISAGTLNDEVIVSSPTLVSSHANKSLKAAKSNKLFKAMQKKIKVIAAIYIAIITGDTDALDTLAVKSGVRNGISKSMEKAVENGVVTQQQLIDSAIEIVALVEKIGCSSDCQVSDNLYSNIAAKITAELILLNIKISVIASNIDDAAAAITAAQALATVTNVDTAISYYDAALSAYLMIFNQKDKNVLGLTAKKYAINSADWVKSATFLVSQNSEFQSILDSAEDTAALASTESAQVNGAEGLHVDARALLTDAQAKLEEFDAVIAAAKAFAESSNNMALEKNSSTSLAQSTAATSFEAAQALANPQSVAQAAAFVTAAEQALADKLAFISVAKSFLTYAKLALVDAQAYVDVAESEEDETMSQELVTSANTLISQAQDFITLAEENLSDVTDLVADANAKQVILNKLPMVKATTQSFADINIITTSGRDALASVGEIMFDVLDEANREPGNVTNKESALHPGWFYDFNEINMTIEASHVTAGSFQGVAELSNDGSMTTLSLAWGAVLNESGDNGATFNFTAGDLTSCATGSSTGSCTTFMFTGVFTGLSELGDEDTVEARSVSHLVITDGAAGFDGTIAIEHSNQSTDEHPDAFETDFTMAGTSGDVSFNIDSSLNEVGEEEAFTVSISVGDDGYMMAGSSSNESFIEGTIKLNAYTYGTFSEIDNGVVVNYIDGEEVEYLDLTFTLD